MQPEAMVPHGLALLAYFRGDESAELKMLRDDGNGDTLAISHYYRTPDEFTTIENKALELGEGRILDVGAGSGIHSCYLLSKAKTVTAIDISPESITILKERGIADAHCVDLFDFDGGPFDTLLMLSHGIGMVENIDGLRRFLEHAHQLTSDQGQILMHSLDFRLTSDPIHLAYHEANRQAGRYLGEIRLNLQFEEHIGPYFGWLHVDPERLESEAESAGWKCKIVHWENDGEYLARLTQS